MQRVQTCDIFTRIQLGIGTWAWGDKLVWGYGNSYSEADIREAFKVCVGGGIRFFDSAEVYGQGKAETILGELCAQEDEEFVIATKMMPFPWRLFHNSLKFALQNSLRRLRVNQVQLYQMHWPLPPVKVDTWMDRMAEVVDAGMVKAVGVSNYNLEQTITAHEALKKRGLRLASNQVEYHLLERRIEQNGLMEYCLEEGIKIIAYSPLAMGILTGKYTPENPPAGTRAAQYNRSYLEKIQPLIKTLTRIGNDADGKSAGQVAINWCIQKGTLPIPGVKNAAQAVQNLGAIGWQLDAEEMALLDEVSLAVTLP
ncbi:MAG TPA: aldo/keto reductase [Anaerolineaceae bacterium]|nr:aldo/keto reductase [Anaerolineaceae bacterium]HQF68181.1 aldo/keto reductase [Anaerolineaceae bacterium]HQK05689.1 aldo/keto reductase [Anaerolineaceae bacterium]HRS73334.1 aldo/keto reductase [Anaerolineaceae bacterium]HRT90908.1 aldo/keto reductase [Anaerolineaceae bacterium]